MMIKQTNTTTTIYNLPVIKQILQFSKKEFIKDLAAQWLRINEEIILITCLCQTHLLKAELIVKIKLYLVEVKSRYLQQAKKNILKNSSRAEQSKSHTECMQLLAQFIRDRERWQILELHLISKVQRVTLICIAAKKGKGLRTKGSRTK